MIYTKAYLLPLNYRTNSLRNITCNCPDKWQGYNCELESAIETECLLACENGGVCTLGFRDATSEELAVDSDFDPNSIANYQHCRCPAGWVGALCENPLPCTLHCNGRGTCSFGQADTSDAPVYSDGSDYLINANNTIDGMFCICNTGWTGVICDASVTYCADSTQPCYHNGVCVEGTVQSSGKSVHVCDCRNADDGGFRYVGLHCEQAAPSADTNTAGVTLCDESGNEFCLHGGVCEGNR